MEDGILLINKPKNITSRDVVNIACKKLNTKKIGHCGTLDPIATGVLVLCCNKATKIIELLIEEQKEYIAEVKIGILTDTLDITGNILEENNNYSLTKEELIEALNSFKGEYLQEVPKYSAIKLNGTRLYDYARDNKEVELPKRNVKIKEIELLEYNKDTFKFKVLVSKGTYIRSLIRDIGNKLNINMTMINLQRTKVDRFNIEDCIDVEDISYDKLIKIEDCLYNYNKVYVKDKLLKMVKNGVKLKQFDKDNVIFIEQGTNKLISIYKKNENNELCSFKVF